MCPATTQVYDVLNFDMIVMIRTPFVPGCVEWIYKVRVSIFLRDCSV